MENLMEKTPNHFLRNGIAYKKTIKLKDIFLHVTKACNLRCRYCYFSASKPLPGEMTSEDFVRIWPDLITVCPEKVIFTGGEPLLRSDILELLQGLKAADSNHIVLRCLNTNGYFVTKQLAQKMVGLVDEVRVSLDGLPELNDALRGKGSFDAAIRALHNFYSVGFEPKILVTVTSYNAPELDQLLCFLIKKEFTRIKLNVFRPIGRGRGHAEWQADPKKVYEAILVAWDRCFNGDPPPPEFNIVKSSWKTCGVGQFLNIMPNGDVFPCHVLTDWKFRCGNVRKQSLFEICKRKGLMGQLASLDFSKIAHLDERFAPLTKRSACMGYVYATTQDSKVWKNSLPNLGFYGTLGESI